MKKLASLMLLVSIAMITAGFCSRADAAQKRYSIQIKAVPLIQKKTGFAIYKDLAGKGYLAYYYKAKAKGGWWMRIRVGVFPTSAEAQKFGEQFRQEEGFDFVVTKAEALVYPYRGGSKIIFTPSTIWMRTGSLNRELYIITSNYTEEARVLSTFKPMIVPDNDRLKFRHLDQEHTMHIIRAALDQKGPGPTGDETRSDETKMLIIEPLPYGRTYQQIKEQYPAMGPNRSMGHGLSHAILKIQAYGHEAGIRFNFKHDKLYGLYYEAYKMEVPEAEALYKKLRTFYADRFGTYIENDYDDRQHHAVLRTSAWSTTKASFSLHRRIAFKKDASLTWGP